jgi:hypothetical protein
MWLGAMSDNAHPCHVNANAGRLCDVGYGVVLGLADLDVGPINAELQTLAWLDSMPRSRHLTASRPLLPLPIHLCTSPLVLLSPLANP